MLASKSAFFLRLARARCRRQLRSPIFASASRTPYYLPLFWLQIGIVFGPVSPRCSAIWAGPQNSPRARAELSHPLEHLLHRARSAPRAPGEEDRRFPSFRFCGSGAGPPKTRLPSYLAGCQRFSRPNDLLVAILRSSPNVIVDPDDAKFQVPLWVYHTLFLRLQL